MRVEGLAYPFPQIRHTFFPSEEESGEEGEEKGEGAIVSMLESKS